MKSMGHVMYDCYRDAQAKLNNCSCDEWHELSDEDRAAYEEAATQFREMM